MKRSERRVEEGEVEKELCRVELILAGVFQGVFIAVWKGICFGKGRKG